MAFRKALVQLFFKPSSRPLPPPYSATPASTLLRKLIPTSGDGQDAGLLRRFIHRRPGYHQSWPAAPPPPLPELLALPVGEKLIDRIRATNPIRIRLDGLLPLPPPPTSSPGGITVAEARKVARAAEMEGVRARLRATGESCVSYLKFAEMCRQSSASGTHEHGMGLARALDESGAVIVLGDVVFLRPEMVAKAIESIIPGSLSPEGEQRRTELKEMEAKKAAIDERAEALVRRELWLGLGFLLLQTAGFMRLTFWELSWDVMEPICFYVTSAYFMAGYAFFLRTSRDPSFEGFFASRFAAKQRRLMKAQNFDVRRFDELRKGSSGGSGAAFPGQPQHCECHRRSTLLF